MNGFGMYPQNPMDAYYRSIMAPNAPVFPPQQNFPPQQIQVNSRFVTNMEEAKAAMIDPLSINLYLDTSSGRIYLKKLGNSGQSEFMCYTAEETVRDEPKDPMREINARLANIECFIGEIRNAKPVPDDAGFRKPPAVPKPTVARKDAADDETEPAGVPEGHGDDKWQKRGGHEGDRHEPREGKGR